MDISSVDCADKTVIEQSSAEIHAFMDISKEREGSPSRTLNGPNLKATLPITHKSYLCTFSKQSLIFQNITLEGSLKDVKSKRNLSVLAQK